MHLILKPLKKAKYFIYEVKIKIKFEIFLWMNAYEKFLKLSKNAWN